jgi:YD repeat-containing protein
VSRGLLLSLFLQATLFAQTAKYSYDSGGHLIGVSYPGGVTVAYTYDAAGHLIARQTTGSTCAVDGGGQVGVNDVQTVINMALGIVSPTQAADLNTDGAINVVDVELMINVALGTGSCPS